MTHLNQGDTAGEVRAKINAAIDKLDLLNVTQHVDLDGLSKKVADPGKDGQSVIITVYTNREAYDAAKPARHEIAVLNV